MTLEIADRYDPIDGFIPKRRNTVLSKISVGSGKVFKPSDSPHPAFFFFVPDLQLVPSCNRSIAMGVLDIVPVRDASFPDEGLDRTN